MKDLLFLALGFGAMIFSARLSKERPSVWNPLIDLGSFAVGGSLIVTQPKDSWARRVGMLQVGVHLAQLVQTNNKNG
jgi:hypothetical protein